jgi:hypothetical protein
MSPDWSELRLEAIVRFLTLPFQWLSTVISFVSLALAELGFFFA